MEAKPAQQNIQDSFLNTARKERTTLLSIWSAA